MSVLGGIRWEEWPCCDHTGEFSEDKLDNLPSLLKPSNDGEISVAWINKGESGWISINLNGG